METELKFLVPPLRRDALAKELRRRKVLVQRLQAIYYDSADGRLAAHGASIRLRKEGRQWVQTAKALTPDALLRFEHNVNVVTPRGRGSPMLDLARHDGTPAGAAIHAALDGTPHRDGVGRERQEDHADHEGGEEPLIERFRIDVSRTARTERVGDACVELALDTGTITAGEQSRPVSEFELELKSGPVQELFALASRWSGCEGLWLYTVSKAERGARLAQGVREGHPVSALAAVIDPNLGASAFLVATLQSCVAQVLGNASEVGAGALDDEFVHQLRVGLRRMRTALRELDSLAPGIDPQWERVFAGAFEQLGARRDAVTVIPAVLREMQAAGMDFSFGLRRPPDIRSPQAVVQDPELQRTLLAVLAFCHASRAPVQREKGARKQLRTQVARLLDDLHVRLARDAKRFPKLSPERQHRVRKRLKRLRYLGEFAAPLFDAKRATRYLESWREAQDALGEYNDYRIGLAAVQADTHTGRRAKAALGWITGRLESCVRRCGPALRTAAKRPVFWQP